MNDENMKANYTFSYCNFVNNEAPMIVGMGSGLGIDLTGNCTQNSLDIHNTDFVHNQGHSGGGLYIQFQGYTQNNVIIVRESKFLNNSASLSGSFITMPHFVF